MMIVTVKLQMCIVIRMVSPPFGKCGQPPAVLCSALPPKRHIYNIIFRHAAQVLRRVFLFIGTFAGSNVCFLPDKNAQIPSILPGGQGGILRRPQ